MVTSSILSFQGQLPNPPVERQFWMQRYLALTKKSCEHFWLVVEPTHLKNMLVKLDHLPICKVENQKYLSCHHPDFIISSTSPHKKKPVYPPNKHKQARFYICFLLDKYERKRNIAYLFFLYGFLWFHIAYTPTSPMKQWTAKPQKRGCWFSMTLQSYSLMSFCSFRRCLWVWSMQKCHELSAILELIPYRTYPWTASDEPRKKSLLFPWNPGCLIEILIMSS